MAVFLDLLALALDRVTWAADTAADGPLPKTWVNRAAQASVPTQNAAFEQPSFGYADTLKGHLFVAPARRDRPRPAGPSCPVG